MGKGLWANGLVVARLLVWCGRCVALLPWERRLLTETPASDGT